MIKIENVETYGWEPAIRGMRNPKNSWDKSDSNDKTLGPRDLNLAHTLAKAGPVHGKFRRMITVCLDITAPLYWWKEFDTYKVGTVVNSTSTMHKLHSRPLTLDDFSHEHISSDVIPALKHVIDEINYARLKFKDTGNKDYWWHMIQLLPSSYNQKRTVQLNYEVLANIYNYRYNHKLDEWREFCNWIETLPYAADLIIGGDLNG